MDEDNCPFNGLRRRQLPKWSLPSIPMTVPINLVLPVLPYSCICRKALGDKASSSTSTDACIQQKLWLHLHNEWDNIFVVVFLCNSLDRTISSPPSTNGNHVALTRPLVLRSAALLSTNLRDQYLSALRPYHSVENLFDKSHANSGGSWTCWHPIGSNASENVRAPSRLWPWWLLHI